MEQGTGVLSQLNMTGDLTGLVCRDLVNERKRVSGQDDQIVARKKAEEEDIGKAQIVMMEKLTSGGKLTSGRFLSLGENSLSNKSLIKVALHKDKHKVSEKIRKKCEAYNKDIKKYNDGTKLLLQIELLLPVTVADNEVSNITTTTKPKALLSNDYSTLLSFKMMNRQRRDKDKIPSKMFDRIALWNDKWKYEPNPSHPVKPREMDAFNRANELPVDVAATSTTQSASSHNVDDHNGCNNVDQEDFLFFF